jgi:3-oxoacyl-[acyl-carrier protein] reductase
MFELTGKGALVTGASGGIGGGIARALVRQGATVVLSGTKADKLEALNAELGGKAQIIACDLADRKAVAELAGKAEAALGHLDIVVNNAGMTKDNLFMLLKDDDWDKVLAVNLTSAFTICRAAVRAMMKRRWGRIINITSVSGIIGNPGQANYAASKAGMIGMTKSMAREVAPRGITANCISPGFIKTAMTDALNEKQTQQIAEHIPAGVFGDPEDIAAATVFLASDEARYVTGQTLHVNGGLAMI